MSSPPNASDQDYPCHVDLPVPDDCCVSPCDPPWRKDEQCIYWYETRYFKVPLRFDNQPTAADLGGRIYIEFRVIYEHKLCLLGKQHGPLLYTQTLLPGEKVTLYHSDRFRRITSETNRFSVQTTFTQFLSLVHEARSTNTLELLADKLSSEKGSVSGSFGGGLAGLIGLPSGSASKQTSVTDHNMLRIDSVAQSFNQSVFQASQMTQAERSVVISNYEETDVANITKRTIQNDNECRAVTYFIRKIMELWALSSKVLEISWRIVAPNFPPEWHTLDDISSLPAALQTQVKDAAKNLPKVGEVVVAERPISLPTDGTVYDPELAHCCSCEPQREAAIEIRLEKQKAEALKACLEVQQLELELKRRQMLLDNGELGSFTPPPAPQPEL
jgi:thermitase